MKNYFEAEYCLGIKQEQNTIYTINKLMFQVPEGSYVPQGKKNDQSDKRQVYISKDIKCLHSYELI